MSKARMLLLLISACSLAFAQSAPPAGTPAHILVTIGHHYGHPPAVLTKQGLTVFQQYDPRPVVDLIPLRGDRAGLEIFLLVDNCSSCEVGSKFEELAKFIRAQPPATSFGVAYIVDGKLKVAENPTGDRERVIKALNPPAGSKPASPFGALADLIDGWNQGSARRAVLMISNGINPAGVENREDPSTEAAVEAAQRGGVTVYAIYHPSADYLTNNSKIYSGQMQLAHVGIETGGEAYFLSYGPLNSLGPFLADIGDHLANQYWLEFLANPSDGPGGLQTISVHSDIPDLEVIVPSRVWVAGPGVRGKPTGE
ncbi:MAG TPA: hypothetical protein VMH05_15945 [Bryobacteraceae bacterium]|nr:hypothetical protein [Bryobacteraceae bacterium]